MKNLKKVLCLALAFAMVLGLVVVGSAAQDVTTLADWDEVANKDAVMLLNACNIMQGEDDGNFNPENNLTRAQAAKMISVALWGGSDDVKLYAGNNVGEYKDVDVNAWYMGYVNFMTVKGIMVGDDKGFRPNDPVSGYELLKMCLVALDYNPVTEGLTGAGWDMRTMAIASKTTVTPKLTAGTTVTDWTQPITRTNAAQVIANMTKRPMAVYSLMQAAGGSTTSQLTETGDSFGKQVLKIEPVVGLLVANEQGSVGGMATDGNGALGVRADYATFTINPLARGYKGENAVVLTDRDKKGWYGANIKTDINKIVLESTAEDLGKTVTIYEKGGRFVYAAINTPTVVAPTFDRTGVLTNGAKDKDGNDTFITFVNGEFVDCDSAATGLWAAINTVAGAKVVNTFTVPSAYTVNYNASLVGYDTNADSYIDIVIADVFDTALANTSVETIKSVDTSEKYGEVYMTNSNKWNETKYTNGQLTGAVVESLRDFTAEKGDKVIIQNVPNCFGQTVSKGAVLELVEGKVTRKSSDNAALYIEGQKYTNTVATLTPTVGTAIKAYILNDTIVDGTADSNDTSNTYALVYSVGYHDLAGTGAVAGAVKVSIDVAAILPDGTDKVFDVSKIVAATTIADADGKNAKTVSKAFPVNQMDLNDVKFLTDLGSGTASSTAIADSTSGADNGVAYKTIVLPDALKNADGYTLMPYALNEDGTITLYVNATAQWTDANRDTATSTTLAAPTSITGAIAKDKSEIGATGKYLTSTTVTFMQNAQGKWSVTTGMTVPAGTIATASKAIVGPLYSANDGVKYLAVLNANWTPASSTATGLYAVLSTPEIVSTTAGVNTYEALIFSSATGKAEVTQYAASGDAGTRGCFYTTLTTGTGFTGKLHSTYTVTNSIKSVTFGYVTDFSNNNIRVAYDNNADNTSVGSKVLGVNANTKYYLINGEESKAITASDVEVQSEDATIAAAGTTAGGWTSVAASSPYQAIVVEAADASNNATGIATMVIILGTAATGIPASR